MRVALTCSEGRLRGLAESLSAQGFQVRYHPLIRTEPLEDPKLRQAARQLARCPWLLFSSVTAVAAWQRLGAGFSPRVGAVGRATAAALRRAGAPVQLVGEPQNAQGLAERFLASPQAAAPVGLPRGDRALPTLERLLETGGFETRPLTIYRTVRCDAEGLDADIVILASPSAAEALPETLARRAQLIALGPSTAQALAARGLSCLQAARPDAEAVLRAIQAIKEEQCR